MPETYYLGDPWPLHRGGLELAVAGDIAIAAQDAVFGEPEVRFGSGIVAMVLPLMVAPKHTKDMLLTGNDQIDAGRAAAISLVTETVAEGRHGERAFEKVRDIVAAAPQGRRAEGRDCLA